MVEGEVDFSAMDAVVIGLGEEGLFDGDGWDVGVCVTADEDIGTGCGFDGFAEWVGMVIGFAVAEVAKNDDGIRFGGPGLGDGFFECDGGSGGGDACECFGHEPTGKAGGDEADEGDFEACDFAHDPGEDLFGSAGEIGSEDGGFGGFQVSVKDFRTPIEVVVAESPCVVLEGFEKVYEVAAFGFVGEGGALVEIADIDKEGVCILFFPLTDLSGAACEAAEIGEAGVGFGGEDVAVKVCGVDD